jgi:hypothetical protein
MRHNITRFLPVLLVPALLAACALPSRKTITPAPGIPSLENLDALKSFDGKIPLVLIPQGNPEWQDAVADAVKRALAIKPTAQFSVVVTAPPVAAGASVQTAVMAHLAPEAAQVANAIAGNGVAPGNITLAAQQATPDTKSPVSLPEILIFVK